MKQYLLPKQVNYYKANLHCHSTISDGNSTPEELVEAYRSHGYSVLALTDHEGCFDHTDLCREDFLLITGYEWACNDRKITDDASRFGRKCYHFNFLAKDRHNTAHVSFDPTLAARILSDPSVIPSLNVIGEEESRVYSVDFMNDVIRRAKEAGYLVAYNHPAWSLQEPEDYAGLRGLYAMEIYNHDCAQTGLFEYDAGAYDCMLRSGQRLGCIATDDAHCAYPFGHPLSDAFGGWTMIAAEKLDYGMIMDSLEKGDFYASRGPEIRELYVENGKVYITSSDAREISFSTAGRRAKTVRANRGETVNAAIFELNPTDVYFRLEVCDWEGMRANSRAYFLDELK